MPDMLATNHPGAPYEVIEFLHPRRWHGFASRTTTKTAFRWAVEPEAPPIVLGKETISQERWVWRGFGPNARLEETRRLETGLLPGAVARRIDVEDE